MEEFGLKNQVKERIKKDDHILDSGIHQLADTVSGRTKMNFDKIDAFATDIDQIKSICVYLEQPVPEAECEYKNIEDCIDFICGFSGITKRHITLDDKWWRDGDGVLLAIRKETGEAVALFPGWLWGYYYIDKETGNKIHVTMKNREQFEEKAWCFYKPLPMRAITKKEYVKFLLHRIKPYDVALIIVASLFVMLVGMLTPRITKIAFSQIVPSHKSSLLISLAVLLVSTAIGSWLFSAVKTSLIERIKSRMNVASENAIFSRILRLPASFFTNKSSGGLAQQIAALNYLPTLIAWDLLGASITLAVSFGYLIQLITIANSLLVPALVVFGLMLLVLGITIWQETKLIEGKLKYSKENSAIVFDFISGVEKIKVSGSEKRAYGKWLESYTRKAGYTFAAKFPLFMRTQMIAGIKYAGLLWFYVIAHNTHISVADFAAFTSAFGLAMTGISSLAFSGKYLSMLKPSLDTGEDILYAEPEVSESGKLVTSLKGGIDINNVRFKYTENGPYIVDDLSISIKPGEYVAFVGKSGCGKSTLIKLMLGFLSPDEGAIYYDDFDIDTVDKRSLRRSIGTVLQNGKLFAGDIFSNITISAPWLTEEDAWKAAEMAGMAEDIRLMPKGMYTMVSEGGGGMSGGQRQRLIIARALAPNPSILLFDEATSALDNITQKKVTESLNALSCTRIVIAHRLSTIRECDRIIALDKGKIVEEGSYEELIAKKGFFADLVSKQLIDSE